MQLPVHLCIRLSIYSGILGITPRISITYLLSNYKAEANNTIQHLTWVQSINNSMHTQVFSPDLLFFCISKYTNMYCIFVHICLYIYTYLACLGNKPFVLVSFSIRNMNDVTIPHLGEVQMSPDSVEIFCFIFCAWIFFNLYFLVVLTRGTWSISCATHK